MMDDIEISLVIDSDYDPPVSLRKTGDFLVLRVKVENDSRDPEARKREIDETLLRLVKAAGLTGRFELHSGEYALTPRTGGIRSGFCTRRFSLSTGSSFTDPM